MPRTFSYPVITYVLLTALLCFSLDIYAQKHQAESDTVAVDSSRLVEKKENGLQRFINSHAFTNTVKEQLKDLLIKNSTPEDVLKNDEPVNSQNYFQLFEGQTIKSVRIKKVPMFTGSVADTTRKVKSELYKRLNQIHISTNNNLILDNVLFKKGDPLNPYEIADSERIIRNLSFIRDARIYVDYIEGMTEGVEVVIVIQDRFPWTLGASFNGPDDYRLKVGQFNILGTGNDLSLQFLNNNKRENSPGYEIGFNSRNIQNTFIDAQVFYADNHLRKGYGATVARDFLSPEIKFGGEVSVNKISTHEKRGFLDTLFYDRTRIKRSSYDIWLARAFEIDERENINFSLRYLENQFAQRPGVEPLINERYHNRNTVLASVSYTSLNFLKTTNIYLFNVTEDIPVGLLISLTAGKDYTEFETRNYASFKASFGKYFDFGFLSLDAETSGFFNHSSNLENHITRIQGTYFSPLFTLGKTNNRWFLEVDYVTAQNLSIPITFDLSSEDRIRDINGNFVLGDKLFNSTVESVYFLPGQLAGFRFAPYIHSDIGVLNESRSSKVNDLVYLNTGIGMRIRNENLVINTFDIRGTYFPRSPAGNRSFGFTISFSTPVLFSSFRVTKPLLNGLE